jgi:Cytochrome P460
VDTSSMLTAAKTLLLFAMVLLSIFAPQQKPSPRSYSPEYTSDAQLKLPEHYREWVYLTSGFDMSYSADTQPDDHHMFDNVFVDPESYKKFLDTGTWPDKTTLVLEVREAHGKGSINQKGHFQSEVMGLEVHVKDEARFPGRWAFFGFEDNDKSGKMVPTTASCYSCHADHAAVDTTFVQFYPTLLPIAKSRNTLSAQYKKEIESPSPSSK